MYEYNKDIETEIQPYIEEANRRIKEAQPPKTSLINKLFTKNRQPKGYIRQKDQEDNK
jgi:hypothetical protein